MAIMSITGLDELINNCQRLAGTEIVQNTNKKILRQVGKNVQATAKNIAPKSKNPWNSGRKGSRTGQHMADVIPVSGVKNKNNNQIISVGWTKSDNSPYFYAKFVEWGTSEQKANPFLFNASRQHEQELNQIAEKEYNNLLKILE